MVVKNKGLYSGLLLSLLCIGNLTANKEYKFLFVNNTPHRVQFSVQYYGSCMNDFEEVDHRGIGQLKSNKQCPIEKFIVKVYDDFTSSGRRPIVESQSFTPGHFTRDKTIAVAVGEPKEVFKIRHWQLVPGFLEKEQETIAKFIHYWNLGRFKFEEYISSFGWDPADEG